VHFRAEVDLTAARNPCHNDLRAIRPIHRRIQENAPLDGRQIGDDIAPMRIVDAFTHCGVSKYNPIEDARRTVQSAGVQRAVLVQHMGGLTTTISAK